MRKPVLLLLISLLILAGCNSNSKDERYNNMSPNEIYLQGVKHVKKKHFELAVEDFEALESRYPFGEYADKAQLGIIYAYYEDENYLSALPATERFIRMYPRHPHVDYVYYMKGLVHFSEALGFLSKYMPMEREDRDPTSIRKSLNAFNTLITSFPDSNYVPDAKQRMIYLRNLVAANELGAARFYLKKGAYVAAANRAGFVVANFDRSPSVPEALLIMNKAYNKLELTQLANSAQQVLVLNYPHSKYAQALTQG